MASAVAFKDATDQEIEMAQEEWFALRMQRAECKNENNFTSLVSAVKQAEFQWESYMETTMRARDAYAAYEQAAAKVNAAYKAMGQDEFARSRPSELAQVLMHQRPDFTTLIVGEAHKQQHMTAPRTRVTRGACASPVTVASLGLEAPWMVRQMPTPPRKIESKEE